MQNIRLLFLFFSFFSFQNIIFSQNSIKIKAAATCVNATKNQYFITIKNIEGGTAPYQISIDNTTKKYEKELIFGSFTHSGEGGKSKIVKVTDASNNINIAEIDEILCGYPQNKAFHDTNLSKNGQTGAILAQVVPSSLSFTANSNTLHYYLLVDKLGKIIAYNKTGLFGALLPEIYSIYALNFDENQNNLVKYFINGNDIQIFKDGLLGKGILRNYCYAICGSATYKVPCPPENTLVCADEVNISLNNDCEITLSASTLLKGSMICDENYKVELTKGSFSLKNNIITRNEVGQKLTYKVISLTTGNFCWGTINVEDKTPPIITCRDVTLSCKTATYNSKRISPFVDNPSALATDKVQYSAMDNCMDSVVVTYKDIFEDLDCQKSNFSAKITRVYVAKDASGNIGECRQQIFFEKTTPAALKFPKDTQLNCDSTFTLDAKGNPAPKVTGWVKVSATNIDDNGAGFCEMKATYIDQNIALCNNSKKILRTWSVEDACTNNTVVHTQTILIVDQTPPYFNTIPSLTFVKNASNNCQFSGNIAYAKALDNCDNMPKFTLKVQNLVGSIDEDINFNGILDKGEDLNNNKILDIYIDEDLNDDGILNTEDTNNNKILDKGEDIDKDGKLDYEDLNNNGIIDLLTNENDLALGNIIAPKDLNNDGIIGSFSGNYTYYSNDFEIKGASAMAKFLVIYSAEDACNNIGTYNRLMTVVDKTPPTAICKETINVSLTLTGTASILASSFDNGSFDDCCGKQLSYEVARTDCEHVYSDKVVFDCSDLGKPIKVNFKVTDCFGNENTCVANVSVNNKLQDNCTTPNLAVVLGKVETENRRAIADVTTNLTINQYKVTQKTNNEGQYKFYYPNTKENFSLELEKNDDILRGVTTYDLIQIQKHILGEAPLSSLYKMIAADINASNNISMADVLALRRVILRIQDTFPNNKSWRFIDKKFQFKNTKTPFNDDFTFVNTYPLYAGENNIDFTAIKIGDIDESAFIDARKAPDTLNIEITDRLLAVGETTQIPIYFNNIAHLSGFQFALTFDKNKIELLDIQENSNNTFFKNNFYTAENGNTFFSWNAHATENLMTSMRLKCRQNTRLSDALKINYDLFQNQIYTTDNQLFIPKLLFGNLEKVNDKFELFQNEPNPTTGITKIIFNIPSDDYVTLWVYDTEGKLIKKDKNYFLKGYNSIKIDLSNSKANGILFYKIETECCGAATKKMYKMSEQ